MSTNPPEQSGTPGDPNPSQWEEIMRSLFGANADEAISEMKSRGIDPSNFASTGLPTDPAALGPMLEQVRNMLANTGGGAVNSQVAHDIARQAAAQGGDPTVMANQDRQVKEALTVAELWLDAATEFGPSQGTARALSRAQWVEETLPAWQSLAEPVAVSVASALAGILKNSLPEGFGESGEDSIGIEISGLPGIPAQFSGMFGANQFSPDQLMRQVGAAVFGMQIGTAAGTLSREVFGFTDIGLPLTATPHTALVPANVDAFSEGLDVPVDEVRIFLALREAAHARLFAHVPWLNTHLRSLVEAYARGITIDMDALEGSIREIDPSDPEQLQGALSSGVFSLESTPEQKQTLSRLETALALIEGWVEEVVARAAIAHLPTSIPLREMLRRRRAAGGPAEQTFASLVGLELRPRRSRDAAALWATIENERGIEGRDAVWAHPDLLPTELDLDDPAGYFSRQDEAQAEMYDLDAILSSILSQADQDSEENSGGNLGSAPERGTETNGPDTHLPRDDDDPSDR